MSNPDNRTPSAPRPGRHRDAQAPLPIRENPRPASPGEFADVQGSQVFEQLKETGRVPVPWESNQPPGTLPTGFPADVAPLAQFTDVSPPPAVNPLDAMTLSPPTPLSGVEHPHFAGRKKG